MSYTYFFLLPNALEKFYGGVDPEDEFDNVARYHIEKTPGTAVILMDVGYWGDYPSNLYWFPEKYHKGGKNVMHLDSRVSFVKGNTLEDLFLIEEATSGNNNYWVNMLNVLDNL